MDLSGLARAMVSSSPGGCRSGMADRPGPLVVGLVGTLGAGKTRFCQELSVALGASLGDVTSPTFTLHRTYEVDASLNAPSRVSLDGLKRWHHLDLYRVADEDELWELGIEELWEQADAWTFMEWADRFAELMPSETVWMEIGIPAAGVNETRDIRCYCQDPTWTRWLSRVADQMGSSDT